MTSNLTEEEREIWKDAYRIHERYHDMIGTDSDWLLVIREASPLIDKHSGAARRLAYELIMAVVNYMGEEQRIRLKKAREQPEQVRMEEIPWN